MLIRDNIKRLRKSKGWSQAKLADESGLAPSTIGTLETRTKRPDVIVLNDVAQALGVTVDELLKEKVK